MNRLQFDSAVFEGVDIAFVSGVFISKIHVTAALSRQAAAALSLQFAFYGELNVRDGFKAIDLDAELANVRVRMDVAGVYSPLILDSERVESFKLVVSGGGEKKKPKAFVKFRVMHSGSPFDLLNFIVSTGGTPGKLLVEKRQAEMFTTTAPVVAEPHVSEDDQPFDGGETVECKVIGPSGDTVFSGTTDDLKRVAESLSDMVIPSDPFAPEWRTADEIRDGVPHHVCLP